MNAGQTVKTESINIYSHFLDREVKMDSYIPADILLKNEISLLLLNDGQNLPEMQFASILQNSVPHIDPLVVIGIYAGENRKQEYGTANIPNYRGEGSKASAYTQFILQELLPVIYSKYNITSIAPKAFAGFSLGGLSALDIVWEHPDIFNLAGVFSGSLWWRTKALGKGYRDDRDRIMQQKIRKGNYHPGLRFFFECGTKDETNDRNNNGIIDAIEDTRDVIKELQQKGYQLQKDIQYLLVDGGKHDETTWAGTMPEFLRWGWGK